MENMTQPEDLQPAEESAQTGVDVKGEALDRSIECSRDFLLSLQHSDGYWVDELEANVTISAEYIFFMHFTDRLDPVKQDQVVKYLLHLQREDGSWPLFYGGLCDINSTVESYLALKMAGLPADRKEMVRARQAIFANGGIKKNPGLHKNVPRHVRPGFLG